MGDFLFPSSIILLEGVLSVGLSLLLLNIIGVAGLPLALAASCLLASAIIAIKLKTRLPIEFGMYSAFHFLFSALILFGIGVSLTPIELAVHSWGGFILYLVTFLASLSAIFVSLNWQSSRDIFRAVIR